jgi:hypothetical protein
MSSTPRWRSWSPGAWKHSGGPKDLTKVGSDQGSDESSHFLWPPLVCIPTVTWTVSSISFSLSSRPFLSLPPRALTEFPTKLAEGGKKNPTQGVVKSQKIKIVITIWCVQGGGSKLKGVSNFRLFTETFLWACVSFYFCGKPTGFLKASGVQFSQSTLNPSLGYSLAHGYHKIIPKPLTESTTRLMYLRVSDSRDRSCKTTPSPSMTVLLTVNQMTLWPISRRKYSHGS